jgi:dTDP-4-amino-4,6-dideoxygalactose transaminase
MPTTSRVPIASVDVRPEDIEAVARVLASGNLRQGAVTGEFEEAFAARVGAKHAVAVSSGTAALHLSYLALFGPGDEVIVPAFTFVATASMLVAMGATPVFADVDPRTFTLSVEDARTRISERTRGIVGVHLFGNACDVDGINGLAADHGLVTVWDAAQALGTEFAGREVGAYGQAVCYSLYPTKNITTGEGGMIVTDDDALARTVRLMRSQGAAQKYLHVQLGFNYRMTDLQASLGLQQLGRLDTYVGRRRANAGHLTAGLEHVAGIVPPLEQPGARHSFNQYSILVDASMAGVGRDELAEALAEHGIETAVHYPRPLHHQPMFERHDPSLPVSEGLCQRILALPVHPKVDQGTAQMIVGVVRGFIGAEVASR